VSQPCALGKGICRNEGVYVCAPDKLTVICVADVGTSLIEKCGDNEDNDCDGETDEGYPVGDACEEGLGACRVTGKYFCSSDRLAVVCSAQSLDPGEEVCANGVDDDCNGQTDESPCLEESTGPTGCDLARTQEADLTMLLLLLCPLLMLFFRRRPASP